MPVWGCVWNLKPSTLCINLFKPGYGGKKTSTIFTLLPRHVQAILISWPRWGVFYMVSLHGEFWLKISHFTRKIIVNLALSKCWGWSSKYHVDIRTWGLSSRKLAPRGPRAWEASSVLNLSLFLKINETKFSMAALPLKISQIVIWSSVFNCVL